MRVRVTHMLIGCLPPLCLQIITVTQKTDHDTITLSDDTLSHVRDSLHTLNHAEGHLSE